MPPSQPLTPGRFRRRAGIGIAVTLCENWGDAEEAMKRVIGGLLVSALTIGSAVGVAAAKVNCEQVRRYLKTGRSAEDIAENMVIDIKEVKKCQETGDAEPEATPSPAK